MPTREYTIQAVKFFGDHDPNTTWTLHLFLLLDCYVGMDRLARRLHMEPTITG